MENGATDAFDEGFEIISHLCHDVANAMMLLRGNIQILEMRFIEKGMNEGLRGLVSGMMVGADSVMLLLQEARDNYALNISRWDDEPVSLSVRFEHFDKSRDQLEKQFGLKLRLTHSVSENCRIYGDLEMAEKVTLNLLQNAAKAGAKNVHVHYQELDRTVEATFSDDGEGMDKGTQSKLGFDISNGLIGGRGVGTIRSLVARAGATIRWDSRQGIGTWVTIRLRKAKA